MLSNTQYDKWRPISKSISYMIWATFYRRSQVVHYRREQMKFCEDIIVTVYKTQINTEKEI